jgi:hypothetical protein
MKCSAGFLLGLFFDSDDMFIRNVSWISKDYTALCPRRWNPSKPPQWGPQILQLWLHSCATNETPVAVPRILTDILLLSLGVFRRFTGRDLDRPFGNHFIWLAYSSSRVIRHYITSRVGKTSSGFLRSSHCEGCTDVRTEALDIHTQGQTQYLHSVSCRWTQWEGLRCIPS